ncbi:hypothetical protein MJG53_005382 [Ovis ammon polii x Ovis aries]|uniref:Ras-specific guanine nucleotide-releasing factor RalGPS1 n=2 Tax=Ovis TaxID=9935 RepID=A0AAD4YHV6_OVIAM|nr:hypothetical protein MG293_003991 [Ovis ammon polii]KAI4587595.1 hypothetical protein MJG53_005382 [Ovis ammon polii x Ovis aries]
MSSLASSAPWPSRSQKPGQPRVRSAEAESVPSDSGIYLLDLIYIDSAYPASGSIMENEQRSNQMNNILRIIADLQVSCSYDHLTTLPHVQKYLKSVRYIEELQKFVEDDNYKLSLRIEPGSSSPRLVSSKEDLAGPSSGSSSARFSRRPTCPDASVAGSLPTPPVPRHRKSHSLGNNMMCQLSVVESKSATFPSEKARHLLDDSVLEPRSPRRGLALASSSAVTNGLSLGSSESSEFSEEMSSGLESPTGPCICTLGSSAAAPTMEGPLRRKTLLKEGRKPAYKSTPGKKVSVVGWMVQLPDDPEHPDIFQLNNPDKGNVYKFQTGSRFHAILWHKHLDDACKSNRPQVESLEFWTHITDAENQQDPGSPPPTTPTQHWVETLCGFLQKGFERLNRLNSLQFASPVTVRVAGWHGTDRLTCQLEYAAVKESRPGKAL